MKAITLPVKKIRELDQRASSDFSIPSLILMENAGRSLADILERNLIPPIASCRVVFVCGTGNNGGDGFVAARHLNHRGVPVEVFLTRDPEGMKEDAAANFRMISKLGIEWFPLSKFAERQRAWDRKPVVIVDAILGTGARLPLSDDLVKAIRCVNTFKEAHNSSVKVVSVDVPSGLDGDSGPLGSDVVRADMTVTFACLKIAFGDPMSRPLAGRIELVDIGIPRRLVENVANVIEGGVR